jgi:hypothetical protein
MTSSTTRGLALGCGIRYVWSRRSKVIGDSDHWRYRGTAGSAMWTSHCAVLRRRLSSYASSPPKTMRYLVDSGKYLEEIFRQLRIFGGWLGDEALQEFALPKLVTDMEAMVLAQRVHQFMETVSIVLGRWLRWSIRGGNFFVRPGTMVPSALIGVLKGKCALEPFLVCFSD